MAAVATNFGVDGWAGHVMKASLSGVEYPPDLAEAMFAAVGGHGFDRIDLSMSNMRDGRKEADVGVARVACFFNLTFDTEADLRAFMDWARFVPDCEESAATDCYRRIVAATTPTGEDGR